MWGKTLLMNTVRDEHIWCVLLFVEEEHNLWFCECEICHCSICFLKSWEILNIVIGHDTMV